jgi:hypothetical protein
MHGRAADRGDDAGSRVIAGAIAASLMRLALLAHRRWAPYEKWLGTAVLVLPEGPALSGLLSQTVTAARWPDREAAMSTAAGLIAAVQRDRGVATDEGAPVLRQYWDRPYRHVDPEVFRGLREAISDPVLARLPAELGAAEQWVSDVETLHRPGRRAALAAAYQSWLTVPG